MSLEDQLEVRRGIHTHHYLRSHADSHSSSKGDLMGLALMPRIWHTSFNEPVHSP